MPDRYKELKEQTTQKNLQYRPVFYRISNPAEKEEFNKLLNKENVFVYDEIFDQLKQLIKSRNPTRKLQDEDYTSLIAAQLNGCPMEDYGVWVYYPWSDRAVHILDEQEFIELRTSANKNKISIAEREQLATKKVGVIGLSVGQSVSVTLAMERICGELRLADFDNLELNNLNRIRTGLHNLGLLKVYSVAREIAEMDPFLKTVCYPEGITDDNIHGFFTEGGKLDAVIDECDGVNIKILCRIKAKELNVPVLMEASDRGTLDVERFDLEPLRPIMHGWLEHLNIDLEVLKNLKTNEEKLPYMLPIAGLETLSSRMKASLLEMNVSLTTWPQLATAVTLGGAITADTCRRMFLDQYTDSGRYFIDLEQLIPDKREKDTYTPAQVGTPLTESVINDLIKSAMSSLPGSENTPGTEEIKQLVSMAVLAPSAGNAQPWKWHYKNGYLFLFRDNAHEELFSDINELSPQTSLGAALENLALAAAKNGYTIHTNLYPVKENKALIAAISFSKEGKDEKLYKQDILVNYINRDLAQSNTAPAQEPAAVFESLKAAVASVDGAELIIKSSPENIKTATNIIGASERLKFFIPASHYEFYNRQLKWPGQQKHEDGIGIETMGLSPAEIMGLRVAMNPDIANHLSDWRGGQALEYTARKNMADAAAIGLVTVPAKMDYLTGGRVIQRMRLAAHSLHCTVVPAQTILLELAHLKNNSKIKIPDHVREELMALRKSFDNLFEETTGKEAIFLFKLTMMEQPTISLPTKPIEKILTFGALS